MNFRRYFRLALFLPYLVAGIAAIWIFIGGGSSSLVYFTMFSVVVAGIPYAALQATIYFWSETHSDKEIKKAMWSVPVVLLPFMVVFFIVISPFFLGMGVMAAIQIALIYWVIALIYGYVYISLTAVCWLLLKKVGWGIERN